MGDWREITSVWQGEHSFKGYNTSCGCVQMGVLNGEPGLSPMELLLAGLGGCTGIDVADILLKKRIQLTELKVKVRGKRAETFPRVYTEIEVQYLLWGNGLDPAAVEQAIQLSEEKYCSASAMLGATAQISSSYHIFTPGEQEQGKIPW
jgi:putative redox protein